MAKYKLVADGIKEIKLEDGTTRYEPNIIGIKDNETNMFIPLDLANRHYQEYQEWLKHGNEPDPSYTLEEVKRLKKFEIKSAFLQAFNQGYTSPTLGIKVDCKKEDLLNFKGALELAEATKQEKITIRDYNNEYHTITVDQLKTLITELIAYHAQLFQKKWDLEKQVDAATDFDSVCRIKWEGGDE